MQPQIKIMAFVFVIALIITGVIIVPVQGLMTKEKIEEMLSTMAKLNNETYEPPTKKSQGLSWTDKQRLLEQQGFPETAGPSFEELDKSREQTEKEYNSMMRERNFYNNYEATINRFMLYYEFVDSLKERQVMEEFETVVEELMRGNETFVGETEIHKEFKQMYIETNEMREKPELEHQWFKETVIKILERELEVTKFTEQKEKIPSEIQLVRETTPEDLYYKFMRDPVVEYNWDTFDPDDFESLSSMTMRFFP